MIHNHSSGKHRLWRRILAVCIAFAMICSVSISAFAVEASSETANENTETVQSGSAEEAEELTATEAENDQSVDEAQPEEPVVTTGDENTEEPTDVIEAPSEDPEQPEEPSVEPGEDNEQPADPTVTEQPEEPTVTEQPEEPAGTPAEDADASVDEVQDVELEAQADAQTVQDIEQEQDPVAVQERWGSNYKNYTGIAAIYYLATPDGIPESNDTKHWAPTSDQSELFGTINTANATWQKVDGKDKNIVINAGTFVKQWPGETGSHTSSWTVKRSDGNTYFAYILDSIWTAYQGNVEKKLGIKNLTKEDVTEITLKPFKISRDNSTKPNQNYHIDCTIDIACKKTFTAKFWIKSPESEYKLSDAKEYIRGRKVEITKKATIGDTKVINGLTYVLDGWYPESDTEGNNSNSKISEASWPYNPSDLELADGTVNFYAHYTPLYTSVDIKKSVTGNMGDKSKKFNFTVSVVNGNTKNTNLPFKIGETPYTDSTTITLSDKQTIRLTQVPVGATVTITEEDYSGSGYTTSYTIGGSDSTIGNTAEISNILQLNENENTAHEVTFTNKKDAIPDTGLDLNITPYILALGIVAAGAGVLLFGRRKRWS